MLCKWMRQRLPKEFFDGACDIHSHLLPGVDDGFPDFEKSMEGLSLLKELGYRKVKLTPHFMRDYERNTRKTIVEKYQTFFTQVGDLFPLELSLGGEYMLDAAFMERFEEGFLTLDKNHTLVLCETSYMMADPNMREMLYQIMLKGFCPVIAHPERYNYASKPVYKRWKEKDYLFQLNLFSLGGAYGNVAKAKAHELLKEGMYDYVGTDLHRIQNVDRFLSDIRLSTKERDRLEILFENNKEL